MRTNGKTKMAGGEGKRSSKKGGGGTGNHKALKAVPAGSASAPAVSGSTPPLATPPPAPDEVETERARPAPLPRAKSSSGEITAQPVVAVEKDFTSAPPIEIDPDVPAVTLPASPPPPPSELAATAPVRTTPPRTAAVPHERFEAHEEAFFSQEDRFTKAEPPPAESFEDLDDGQPRPGFWKRLFKKMRG